MPGADAADVPAEPAELAEPAEPAGPDDVAEDAAAETDTAGPKKKRTRRGKKTRQKATP